MKKSNGVRRYRRSLNLDNITLPGDQIVKASHIVAKSKLGEVPGLSRFHNVEDFMEVAFSNAIADYEKEHGPIVVAPSGIYAYDSDPTSETE
jgi:hypothetical protein